MTNREPVQINRDPFARASLMRIRADHPDAYPASPGPCRWCGQPARFSYGWQGDQNRDRAHFEGPFCSVSCYRIHTGHN